MKDRSITIPSSKQQKKEAQITLAGQSILQYTLKNPDVMPIVTKLVDGKDKKTGRFGENQPPVSLLQQIAERNRLAQDDIANIYEIIPETATVETITVSSILSPNDFAREELIWTIDGDFPLQLSTPLIEKIRETFEKVYKINDHLKPALTDALFRKGSYIFAVIPESAIDDVIAKRTTIGFESYKPVIDKVFEGRGLIGNYTENDLSTGPRKAKTSFEGVFYQPDTKSIVSNEIHTGLTIIDNPDVFKLPQLVEKYKEERIRQMTSGVSLESATSFALNIDAPKTNIEVDKRTLADALYQDPNGKQLDMVQINSQDNTSRKTFGRPLFTTLPHMSTIPVHIPGDPEEHVGYFVLLDQNGRPVSYTGESSLFDQSRNESNSLNGQNDAINKILREIKTNVKGKCCCNDNTSLEELDRVYQSLIERDLLARLNNGIHGENVALANVPEIYRIMLSRALAGLRTQILFLPSTLVEYVAFEYDKYGVGESLVKKARMHAAMVASGIYAAQIAMLKNAIQNRVATLKLDPTDPDPWKRQEQMLTNLMKSNNYSAHFSQVDPRQIEASLARIAVEVVTEGHPDLPEMSVDVQTKSGDRAIVEDTVLENNRGHYIRALKSMPSVIDMTGDVDFAAQVVNQNAILARQYRMYSIRFANQMTNAIRKVALQDGQLLKEMTTIISGLRGFIPQELLEESKESALPIIERFLEVLKVSLPLPEVKTENKPSELIRNYQDLLDAIVPVYFPRDKIALLIPEPAETEDEDENARQEIMKQTIDRFEDWVKNQLMRKFITDNNLFPELREVLFLDSEHPNVELMKLYMGEQKELAETLADVVADIHMSLRGNTPTETPDTEGGDDETPSENETEDTGEFNDDEGSGGDEENLDEEPQDEEDLLEEEPDDEMPDI